MTRVAIVAALLALAAGPGTAQQHEYDPIRNLLGEIMQGCLANSQDREDDAECAGLMTEVCIAAGPGHWTTYGLNSCTAVLWGLWDDELNRLWPQLLAAQTPVEAEVLRARQRTWIAERDADCQAAADEMGGGSAATFTLNGCLHQRTAERVAEFRDMLEIAGP
jgi:uncharacterized protein YecT (DUF1311 family)